MNKKTLKVLLIILILIPGFSFAQAGDSAVVMGKFEQAFYNKTKMPVYFGEFCSDNVRRLLKLFQEENINLSDYKVLFLFRRKPNLDLGSLMPENSRIPTPGWVFHVIIVTDNKVFDLDFNSSPLVLETEEYFATMFPSQMSDILVKEFSANQYLDMYFDRNIAQRPVSMIIKSSDLEFPPQKLRDWLYSS